MFDAGEVKTTKGTSFILYGNSASRKTRTVGTFGTNSTTLHVSLDSGSSGATDMMNLLEIEGATHKVVVPVTLKELGDIIVALHTNKGYKDNIDTVVIDNLVVITGMVANYVSASPRYKKDALHIEDALNEDTDKNAAGSKMMPYYHDIQRLTKELINQILTLKDTYNIIMMAGEVSAVDAAGSPITTPLINGPRSTVGVTSLFDNVFRTSYKEGDFDTKDHVATKFKLSTFTDPLTGMQYFGKTRSITNMDYLKANEMPANFHEILSKEIGYIYKKDRTKK